MLYMWLNEALEILQKRGRDVQTNPCARLIAGVMHVRIDGEFRSESEIFQVVMPEDQNVYGFEAKGKQYEVHIDFPCVPYSERSFEVLENGKTLNGRIPTRANELECARRIAQEHGGLGSLRRLH